MKFLQKQNKMWDNRHRVLLEPKSGQKNPQTDGMLRYHSWCCLFTQPWWSLGQFHCSCIPIYLSGIEAFRSTLDDPDVPFCHCVVGTGYAWISDNWTMSLFLPPSLLQDGFNNFKTFVEEELQTSMVCLNQLPHDWIYRCWLPSAGNALLLLVFK